MTATDPARAISADTVFDLPLRVSAKADYAIRALTEIAASGGGPLTAQRISRAQAIPAGFMLSVLGELRRAGLVRSHRGSTAGYELARPAGQITLADIISIIQRDLSKPTLDQISYPGAAEPLRDVWLAVQSALSGVLGAVTLADIASGSLPHAIEVLARRQYPPRQRTPDP